MAEIRDPYMKHPPKDPELHKRILRRRKAKARLMRAFARRGLDIQIDQRNILDTAWVTLTGKPDMMILTYRGLRRLWVEAVRGGRERRRGRPHGCP